ncbi:TetR/AcrR family transcriptional regulator [Phreatobacter stygius]|uniref:TetR/AcrR family transcriptional regulator n=2 Tax=Phreatobacter stygius TaxID=1940610 RepID=A0A4D7BIT2_9HYPH|nr:TetR/AcrR family transcriptional regulator [Phreatobacter stygius]
MDGTVALRPRERIVATARDLFRRHGIRAVGVDAIAEAARTNKMTLYRHFRSKDELIVECMQRAVDESNLWWDQFDAEHPDDPLGQIKAWIERGAECIGADERGCEMATAAIDLAADDHPARRVIEAGKKLHRDRFVDLCVRAGLVKPELVADTLWLLLEGARISRQSAGAEGPSAHFKRMAEAMITAAGGGRAG